MASMEMRCFLLLACTLSVAAYVSMPATFNAHRTGNLPLRPVSLKRETAMVGKPWRSSRVTALQMSGEITLMHTAKL